MRYLSTLVPVIISMAIACSAASGSAAPAVLARSDDTAIRSIVASFAASWNRHDMAAMHALTTPDVEWVNVVGNDWRGRDEVRRGHTNFLHVLAAATTCSVESVAVRQIAPDVAIAVTVFRFQGKEPDGKPGDTRTRSSMVVLKRGGEWKIVHQQNTVINPHTQGAADPLNFDEKTGLPKGAK
jgi:uncharacterized protein (TIGR02246 family)